MTSSSNIKLEVDRYINRIVEMGHDRYQLKKLLGRGTYGRVYLANSINVPVLPYAIKIIDHLDSETEHETVILRYLATRHPNENFYPCLKQTCLFSNAYVIVMEAFHNHISINEICKHNLQFNYFRRGNILMLFQLIVRLHNLEIVHLDLSPSNIMFPLNKEEKKSISISDIKLIDYATARLLNNTGERLGLDKHINNVTTSSVISPFTSLLFQEKMIPIEKRVDLKLTRQSQNLFYKMSDLWSIFHVACFFLSNNKLFFIYCEELLSHLNISKVWDQDGHPILVYLLFCRDLFFLKKEKIDVLKSYLLNKIYFADYDSKYLLSLLDILLQVNIHNYQTKDYIEFSKRLLIDPYNI